MSNSTIEQLIAKVLVENNHVKVPSIKMGVLAKEMVMAMDARKADQSRQDQEDDLYHMKLDWSKASHVLATTCRSGHSGIFIKLCGLFGNVLGLEPVMWHNKHGEWGHYWKGRDEDLPASDRAEFEHFVPVGARCDFMLMLHCEDTCYRTQFKDVYGHTGMPDGYDWYEFHAKRGTPESEYFSSISSHSGSNSGWLRFMSEAQMSRWKEAWVHFPLRDDAVIDFSKPPDEFGQSGCVHISKSSMQFFQTINTAATINELSNQQESVKRGS